MSFSNAMPAVATINRWPADMAWMVWRNKKARGEPALFVKSIADLRLRILADGGSSGGLRAVRLLLDDAGRLAAQGAQVIQFGAAHLAAAHHGDRIDHRRHHGEYAFHALPVGKLEHPQALIGPAARAGDAH